MSTEESATGNEFITHSKDSLKGNRLSPLLSTLLVDRRAHCMRFTLSAFFCGISNYHIIVLQMM